MDMLFNFVSLNGVNFAKNSLPDNRLRLTVAPDMEYYYDKESGEIDYNTQE